MAETPPMLRPIPRRAFEITPASSQSSIPPSPPAEAVNPDLLNERKPETLSSSRTRSILNLTSSTLLGIYANAGSDGGREETSTPWGTGAQTPSTRASLDEARPQAWPLAWNAKTQQPQAHHVKVKAGWLKTFVRSSLLFLFGVAYGTIITHLHRRQKITPVRVPGVEGNMTYQLLAWGVSGVLLGNALPWVDTKLAEKYDGTDASSFNRRPSRLTRALSESRRTSSSADSGPNSSGDWYAAVRSIGAFVGIAFAVRKLPWQSTLQVSLTLALANPFLWYLIDRSKAGFAFSTGVGLFGTIILLCTNPGLVPLPALSHQPLASSEVLGSFVWLASILFCTSLCFGAIGRRVQS